MNKRYQFEANSFGFSRLKNENLNLLPCLLVEVAVAVEEDKTKVV